MMREDLFDLADYAESKGMRVSITPSATPNVTEKMRWPKKSVCRWAFSLDAPNAGRFTIIFAGHLAHLI